MHTHVARCSSAVRRTAIQWCLACRPLPKDTTGSTGSLLKPLTGSSCSLVKQKQSRRTGSLPFRESSTDPWCRRSTQVHTIEQTLSESWLIGFNLHAPSFLSPVEAHFKHKPWCWLQTGWYATGGTDWTINSKICPMAYMEVLRTERVHWNSPFLPWFGTKELDTGLCWQRLQQQRWGFVVVNVTMCYQSRHTGVVSQATVQIWHVNVVHRS